MVIGVGVLEDWMLMQNFLGMGGIGTLKFFSYFEGLILKEKLFQAGNCKECIILLNIMKLLHYVFSHFPASFLE